MDTVVAVVVTYNRLLLLKECINALKKQTKELDGIIVINNSSSDGTFEWLNNQKDLTVIHQENGGGALGFYRGMKEGFNGGFDWIWLMDDDVEPHMDCLEILLNSNQTVCNSYQILQPDRGFVNCDKRWQYGSKFNFFNPFKPEAINPIRTSDFGKEKIRDIVSFPFEGPLLSRKVIESVGLPNKEYFIWYDDTDYSVRVFRAGFKVGLVRDALMIKKIKSPTVGLKVDWKCYYQIRNQIIIDRKYGNNFISVSRAFYNNGCRLFTLIKQAVKHGTYGDLIKNLTGVYQGVRDGFKFKN